MQHGILYRSSIQVHTHVHHILHPWLEFSCPPKTNPERVSHPESHLSPRDRQHSLFQSCPPAPRMAHHSGCQQPPSCSRVGQTCGQTKPICPINTTLWSRGRMRNICVALSHSGAVHSVCHTTVLHALICIPQKYSVLKGEYFAVLHPQALRPSVQDSHSFCLHMTFNKCIVCKNTEVTCF